MIFITPQASLAGLITLQEMQNQKNQSLQEQLQQELNKPEMKKQLALLGISEKEARERLAALNESETRDLIQSQQQAQAGGDLAIILLVIIIILLIR